MPRHIWYLLNLSANSIVASAETQDELMVRMESMSERFTYAICQGVRWYQAGDPR